MNRTGDFLNWFNGVCTAALLLLSAAGVACKLLAYPLVWNRWYLIGPLLLVLTVNLVGIGIVCLKLRSERREQKRLKALAQADAYQALLDRLDLLIMAVDAELSNKAAVNETCDKLLEPRTDHNNWMN